MESTSKVGVLLETATRVSGSRAAGQQGSRAPARVNAMLQYTCTVQCHTSPPVNLSRQNTAIKAGNMAIELHSMHMSHLATGGVFVLGLQLGRVREIGEEVQVLWHCVLVSRAGDGGGVQDVSI